jgi:DNA adenine methylase
MLGKNQITAFPWYGGKISHLKWLLPIINGQNHITYVESFGGSAAILLNKIPSQIEVYNDICEDVVNFFKTLREQREELISLLELTPYSRKEFTDACLSKETSNLERARQFFVKARQSRNGLATTASPGRWSYDNKNVRRGMSLVVSRWLSTINGLENVCNRLKTIIIENLDGLDVIKRYDTENTLHYIDPPYYMDTNCDYRYNFDNQHEQLLNLVKEVKGKVIISGYESSLYSDMLSGWNKYKAEKDFASSPIKKKEIIWTNFKEVHGLA